MKMMTTPNFSRVRVLLASVALLLLFWSLSVTAAPVHLVSQSPLQITRVAPDVQLIDFGRVAFGNVRLIPPVGATGPVVVHFGESLRNGRIDRSPPGTVRYESITLTLTGRNSVLAAPAANVRNTELINPNHPPAILTSPEWGVVLPFRWVEIEGWPGDLHPSNITRQAAFSTTWDEDAAAFTSSDVTLNRIWDLCRYSIKATTFAGIYVDGDRERIPYEADSYLNQISHYTTDNDLQFARETFDHLMIHGTWPSEWAPHLVMMAYADWQHTGDTAWLASRYEALKAKLLTARAGPDGLILSNEQQRTKNDIVDWPLGERDGYVFTSINTVVNAFHLRTLTLMAEMAAALGHAADAAAYTSLENNTRKSFQARLFDATRGVYRDGVETDHASIHANLFTLAFGLVPEELRAKVSAYVVSRGMACSVYAAQYLLEGLFANDAGTEALDLILAANDRSWRHMVESGTTITWEAWDQKYKPNQDWNHAWGAAPANLLPHFVLGAQPGTPGWRQAVIRPHPGRLSSASGKVPTPRGPIILSWESGSAFKLTFSLPPGMTARVELPVPAHARSVTLNGHPAPARRVGYRLILDQAVSGKGTLEVR